MQVQTESKPYDTINVTPMLDLAYVLLVVFILMTTASIQGLGITMPKPSNKPTTEQHEMKVVQVTASGAVLMNGTAVSLEELEAQPAASKTDPTAAAVATIAFDARKVKPSPCRPQGFVGGKRWHLG